MPEYSVEEFTASISVDEYIRGLACSYVGKCYYCVESDCSRLCGESCRHPHLLRPSLEAYGFDVARTTQELFGVELRWGKDGNLPDYLIIVCAFFHNSVLIHFNY